MKTLTTYQCEICHEIYESAAKARACEAQGVPEPTVAVGDIVFTRQGFGWFDGDPRWVSNPHVGTGQPGGYSLKNRDQGYVFYYVVTCVETQFEPTNFTEHHRVRYHVMTKAMTGEQGYRGGFTYDQHHITPKRVTNPPPFVLDDSKDLLGQKMDDLL